MPLKIIYLLVRRVLGLAVLVFRTDLAKDAELLVLRHENALLRRHVGRVHYEPADRVWLAALARLIPPNRWAEVFPVTPATLLAWHRRLPAKKYDTSKRRKPGLLLDGPGHRPAHRPPGEGESAMGAPSDPRRTDETRREGQEGRPSRSLTLDQALAVMTAAATLPVMELRPGLKDVRRPAELMHAYITLSLLCGLRTEEARALRWAHVDLDGDPAAAPPVPPHIAVWRSVRAHGETKTERSRRTLALPAAAVEALRAWSGSQAGEQFAAGEGWQDTGLVFTNHAGAALDAGNVRKMFKRICTEAGAGDSWTPRELRTTFVSLLSHQGVAIEEIARLVGHATTRTTEIVYRRELRPVITTGAEIMDQLFTGT